MAENDRETGSPATATAEFTAPAAAAIPRRTGRCSRRTGRGRREQPPPPWIWQPP